MGRRRTGLLRCDGYKVRHASEIKALRIISQRLAVSGFSSFQITCRTQARPKRNCRKEKRTREGPLRSWEWSCPLVASVFDQLTATVTLLPLVLDSCSRGTCRETNLGKTPWRFTKGGAAAGRRCLLRPPWGVLAVSGCASPVRVSGCAGDCPSWTAGTLPASACSGTDLVASHQWLFQSFSRHIPLTPTLPLSSTCKGPPR